MPVPTGSRRRARQSMPAPTSPQAAPDRPASALLPGSRQREAPSACFIGSAEAWNYQPLPFGSAASLASLGAPRAGLPALASRLPQKQAAKRDPKLLPQRLLGKQLGLRHGARGDAEPLGRRPLGQAR